MVVGIINSKLRMTDTETVWEDLRIAVGQFKSNGAGADPAEIVYKGVKIPEFTTLDELSFVTQMPHDYKEGSDYKVHLHWTPHSRGVAEDGNTVNWRVDLSIANIDGTFPVVATYDLTDTCANGADAHLMSTDVVVSGTGLTISHIILGRVYRIAGDSWATNTAGNNPALLEVDFHYEIDDTGSATHMVK